MSISAAKVSIIMPVYNAEETLSYSLGSCLSQTLYNIEIICVNDGSTDNSQKILDDFAQQDHRVRIINQKNAGPSAARNNGLNNATGEIVMFLDSDDRLEQNACERIWCEFCEAPTDILCFGFNMFPSYPKPTDWFINRSNTRTIRYWEFQPFALFCEIGAKPFVWQQAFKREFIEEHKIRFNEELKLGEDQLLDICVFPHAKNIAFIQDHLYNYRWYNKGSLMDKAKQDLDKRMVVHLDMCERATKYWSAQGWLKKYGDWYLDWLLDFMVYDINQKDVQKKSSHFARLDRMIKTYGLDKPWYKKLTPQRQALVEVMEKYAKEAKTASTTAAKTAKKN